MASRVCCKWHVPQSPFVTCNVDASFSNELGKTKLGMVVHDSRDRFLVGQSSWVDGCLPIRERGATGLREALSWVKQLGFQNVKVKTYAKYVAKSLDSKKPNRSKYGSLIRECSSILSKEDGFSVHFVRRQANEIAHVLAKLSCSLTSPMA